MSDNEKLEKENEQFSSAVLYVATAMYVGVCAMVFGALYAKLPSFGEAFLTLMKDYGTILAGIPVLVAVVVAKQQLDANRAQHYATMHLKFVDELKALEAAQKLSLRVIARTHKFGLYKKLQVTASELKLMRYCRDEEFRDSLEFLRKTIEDNERHPRAHIDPEVKFLLRVTRSQLYAAQDLLVAIEHRKKFLRQFLPNLT